MNGFEKATRSRFLNSWGMVVLAVGGLITTVVLAVASQMSTEVRVMSPVYEDIETSVSTRGIVSPAHDYPTRALFGAQVEAVYVHLGQEVKPGQMLIRLRDQFADSRLEKARVNLLGDQVTEANLQANGSQEDRITNQAELVRDQTEESQAATELKSIIELEKRGSASEAEVETAKQRLSVAQANLASLQKKMTQRYSSDDIQKWKNQVAADKSTLEAEKVSWRSANISSPIAGTVYLLPTRPYDFVPAGIDLMHVANLKDLEVRANFDEIDIGQLHLGMPVDVNWDGIPGKTWQGHLIRKPMALSRTTDDRRVGECVIALDGDASDLPVNADVAVHARTNKRAHVLTISRDLLRTDGPEHYVYLVADGRLRRTPVEIGLLNSTRVEVTKGLNAGDTIALKSIDGSRLENGMRAAIAK